MKRFFRRNRKAVSPVIATIIIVGIAIVMSIAVAYWLMGLVNPGSEKLQFVSGYATYDSGLTEFTMNVTLKNVGSKDATIDMVFLNSKPETAYTTATVTWDSKSVKIGATVNGTIVLDKGTDWTNGISVDVNVHTVAGYEYPKSIVLP